MTDYPLYVTKEARDKFWGYIVSYADELGGFGFATIDTQGRLVWYDTFLVDQEATKSAVDFSDKGITQAIERATAADCFSDPNFTWVWWHSHNSMGTFWSTTDESGVTALKASGVPYMLSVVGNHKLESKVRMDWYKAPIVEHVTIENFKLVRYPDDTFEAGLHDDIAEFVRKPKPSAPVNKTQSGYQAGSPGGKGTEVVKSNLSYRKSDPGGKLEAALQKAAEELDEDYADLRQHEQTESAFLSGEALGDDCDDDGVHFNWTKVVDWIADVEEVKEWESQGFDVVKYQNEYFLLEPSSVLDDEKILTGEVVS